MNSILIIGAGMSSSALIQYVLEKAEQKNWTVTVADADLKKAERRVANSRRGRPAWLDVTKVNDRRDLISRADVIVSLLPAHLHIDVAQDCIKLHKHLITASYVSQEMYRLGDEARNRELIFMGEMGLDPGVDHMSAMEKIDMIREKGGEITAFRSYAGGLIAPESDDNPWHYKFTWNPRNVVLAGQGTAQYLENGKFKYIPYHRLFRQHRPIHIDGLGEFEVYPNRDSLLYREVYGMKGIPNILRGTIRYPGFCDAWHALVKIGMTDGSYPILDSGDISYLELMEAYTSPKAEGKTIKERLADTIGEEPNSAVMEKLEWLGLFSRKRINLPNASPAFILEDLLQEKWKMKKGDRDMVIMQHEFVYRLEGTDHILTSSLVLKGEDDEHTAMAKLVGLPLGIFVNLVMDGKITATGVNIPVMKEVYRPVLKELEQYGVVFSEKHKTLD